MDCPYCGKELEAGYIRSSDNMVWSREKELGLIGKEDIRLVKNLWKGMLEGNFVEAHCCRACKKLIVPLDEFIPAK